MNVRGDRKARVQGGWRVGAGGEDAGMWGGALRGSAAEQVLEALGSFWKEFSANSNEDSQGFRPGRTRPSLPVCSHGLLPSSRRATPPPTPHPAGATHQWHQLPLPP